MTTTVDSLLDQLRATEAALAVERGHREAAEAYAASCERLVAELIGESSAPVVDRRTRQNLCDWTGLDRRQTH